jgi:hypothetical protein
MSNVLKMAENSCQQINEKDFQFGAIFIDLCGWLYAKLVIWTLSLKLIFYCQALKCGRSFAFFFQMREFQFFMSWHTPTRQTRYQKNISPLAFVGTWDDQMCSTLNCSFIIILFKLPI